LLGTPKKNQFPCRTLLKCRSPSRSKATQKTV
jgi:hypothetical protein